MPTYDYVCDDCGHQFEIFQSMKESPIKDCPECRKPAARRRIGGGTGIIFKGSGFYVNDSKKKTSESSGTASGASSS